MIRILSSEWLKTKRTAVRWITFFMPVVTALCIVAYISGRAGVTADFIYEGFFYCVDGGHHTVRGRAACRFYHT